MTIHCYNLQKLFEFVLVKYARCICYPPGNNKIERNANRRQVIDRFIGLHQIVNKI